MTILALSLRRRVQICIAAVSIILSAGLILVQWNAGPDVTRILVMCTDPPIPAPADGVFKEPPPQRSDVMFVVELDQKERKVVCTQIPRDTMAYICPQSGLDKVNASVSIAGASRSRSVVGSLIGAKVHHYVVVSIPDFLKFCEIIGGVEVLGDSSGDLANGASMSDSSDPKRQEPAVLKDQDALQFVMSRPGSDIDREERQHRFVAAISGRCSKLSAIQLCRVAAWAWNLDGDISPVQMVRYGRLCLGSHREFRSLATSALYLNGSSYLLAAEYERCPWKRASATHGKGL